MTKMKRLYTRIATMILSATMLSSYVLYPIKSFSQDANNSSSDNYTEGIDGMLTGKSVFYKLSENSDNETLILPTNTGIYFTEGDTLVCSIKTDAPVTAIQVIEDVDGDSKRDVACIVKSANFDNVRVYSSSNGNLLWSWASKTQTYDNSKGWYYANVTPYSIVSTQSGIAVITNYTLNLLDTKTGNVKWKYEDKNNIWTVLDLGKMINKVNSEIAVGNQLGEAIALDAENGRVIWKIKVVPDYEFTNNSKPEKCTRSIWQLSYILQANGSNKLCASGEDGIIYELNPEDGSITASHKVYEYNNENLQNYYSNLNNSSQPFINIAKVSIFSTGFNDPYFNGIRIEQIDDVNDDGVKDTLVIGFLGSEQKEAIISNINSSRTIEGLKPFVAVYNGNNFEKLWETSIEITFVGSQPIITKNSEGKVIIAIAVTIADTNKLVFTTIDAKDGKLLNDISNEIPVYNTLNVDPQIQNNQQGFAMSGSTKQIMPNQVTTGSSDKLMTILQKSSNGKIFFGQINGNNSFIFNADLTKLESEVDSLIQAKLIASDEVEQTLYLAYSSKSSIIKKLEKLDKQSLEKKWTVKDINVVNAIATEDFTKDGIKDVLCQTEEGILLINGLDGSKIFENDALQSVQGVIPANMVVIGDYDKDGIKDISFSGNIVSSKSGNLIAVVNVATDNNAIWKDIADVNGDGIFDKVLIAETKATQYLSVKQSTQTVKDSLVDAIIFEKTDKEVAYTSDAQNGINHFTFGSLGENGDYLIGFYQKISDNIYELDVVSTKDMKTLFKINAQGYGESLCLVEDFNGDGFSDIQSISENGTKIKIINSSNGDTFWESRITNISSMGTTDQNGYMPNEKMQAARVGDPNSENYVNTFTNGSPQIIKIADYTSDGKADLACTYSDVPESGNIDYGIGISNTVALFDATKNNAEPIKIISIAEDSFNSNNTNYGVKLTAGHVLFYKVEALGELAGRYILLEANSATYILYDIKEDKKIIGCVKKDNVSYVSYIDSGRLIIGGDNVDVIDTKTNLKINNLNTSDTITSPYKIKWEKEGKSLFEKTNLIVNETLIADLIDSNQEVRLPQGEVNLRIESMDDTGRIAFYDMTANVRKSMMTTYAVVGLSILSIAVLVSFVVVPKARRNYMLKEVLKK